MDGRYPWLTRRNFLSTVAGAAVGATVSSLGTGEAAVPLQYDGSKFKLSSAEPNPKRGGVLRYGVLSAPALCISRGPCPTWAHRAPCTTT
jgi:hypothetical protein